MRRRMRLDQLPAVPVIADDARRTILASAGLVPHRRTCVPAYLRTCGEMAPAHAACDHADRRSSIGSPRIVQVTSAEIA